MNAPTRPLRPTARTTVEIVAVLDLLDGRVVRGVAGRRDEYRPVESVLCAAAEPAAIGRAFADHLGLAKAYVADLDAIGGTAEPAWHVYRQLAECGLALWVDAGLRDVDRALDVANFCADGRPLAGVVAGLETVIGVAQLAAMFERVGAGRLVLSLDMHNGRPYTVSPEWQRMTIDMILDTALEIGVQRFIVLDLARVGTGTGVGTERVCRDLRRRAPDVQITAGGGVRDGRDLRALALAGCDAALVASALHDGRIGKREVRRANQEG